MNISLDTFKDVHSIMSKETKDKKEIANYPLFELQMARIFLKTEVEELNKLESEALGGSVSEIQKAAGIDRFEKYGPSLQIDSLAAGKVWKWEAVKKLDYWDCFLKLRLETERDEYRQKELEVSKLMKGKE